MYESQSRAADYSAVGRTVDRSSVTDAWIRVGAEGGAGGRVERPAL
jgi:hypothetical protein